MTGTSHGRQLPSNIVWRGRVAQVRVRVPADLQAIVGKAIIRESLNTSDFDEARRLGLQRLGEILEEWEDIRRRVAPTSEAHRRIAHAVYLAGLERDRLKRARIGDAVEIDAALDAHLANPDDDGTETDWLALDVLPELEREDRRRERDILRSGLRTGSLEEVRALKAEIEREADEAIIREKLLIQKGGDEYRAVVQTVIRARLELLERQEERDGGVWSGKPRDDIVTLPEAPEGPPQAKPGESIMEEFEKYAAANPNGIKADTLAYSRACIRTFADSLPPGFPASAITKKEVREWYDLLRLLPVKAAEVTAFKGMDIRAIVAANEKLKRPVISRKTANKYLSALGGFCRWLTRRGVLDANPTDGLYDKIDKSRRPVGSYSDAQLQAIFGSPLFNTCAGDGAEHKPGDVRIRDWRFWLPLVALFTGCRMGEIAQLLVEDVRQLHGQWTLYVTDDGGDGSKSLKTGTSRRVIPVHSDLAAIGFLKFRERQAAAGHKRLFPEIKPDARGQISGNPSRWYGRYLQRIKVKHDRTINFHSYRHRFADQCREAGYLDSEFGFILGHADQGAGTTRGYGTIPEGNLARRIEIIEAVKFRGLLPNCLAI